MGGLDSPSIRHTYVAESCHRLERSAFLQIKNLLAYTSRKTALPPIPPPQQKSPAKQHFAGLFRVRMPINPNAPSS